MKHLTRFMGRMLAVVAFAGAILWLGSGGGNAAIAAQAGPRVIPAGTAADQLAQASPEQLTVGCNLVTLSGLTVGASISDWVQANVQPASAVVGVWHYDNVSQHYQASYFADPSVPVDAPTFQNTVDAYFICVNAPATAP